MARGRKPKPTRLKILQGNLGKRPLNGDEPRPRTARPTCPAWLDREAKAQWRKLAPELARLGLLTAVDVNALAAYCQAWAEFLQATRELQKSGRYQTTANGYLQSHPAVAQQRTAWKAIRDFAALFGLDPSSRSKLHTAGPADESDPFEEFLSGGRKKA